MKDATAYALEIQRHIPPAQWPQALDRVPEQLRAEAERYLRDVTERIRTARSARRALGQEAA